MEVTDRRADILFMPSRKNENKLAAWKRFSALNWILTCAQRHFTSLPLPPFVLFTGAKSTV